MDEWAWVRDLSVARGQWEGTSWVEEDRRRKRESVQFALIIAAVVLCRLLCDLGFPVSLLCLGYHL